MDKGIAAVIGGEGEEKKKRERGKSGKKGIFPNLPKMTLLGD